ncbi:MAG: hypothetical protein RIR96_76 [Bacteroidota bacterium]
MQLSKNIFLFALTLALQFSSMAQSNKEQLEAIDKDIFKLGKLSGMNVANITETVTSPYNSKRQKAMAIYCWIGRNISWNIKAIKSSDPKNTLPENVVALRTSNALGFANLYQEMCSQCNIRCLVVDGFVKYNTEQFDEIPEQVNASWNVVQLGNTPSEWYYVDAFKSAGFSDPKWTTFYPEFSDVYFFPNKEIFNLEHYPDNTAWLLSRGPSGLKDFIGKPITGRASYENGLAGFFPDKGKCKAKLNQKFRFSLRLQSLQESSRVELKISEGNKPAQTINANLEGEGNDYFIDHIFKKEAEYKVTVLMNGKELITYLIEVEE